MGIEYSLTDMVAKTGKSERTIRRWIRDGRVNGELRDGKWIFSEAEAGKIVQKIPFLTDPAVTLAANFEGLLSEAFFKYVFNAVDEIRRKNPGGAIEGSPEYEAQEFDLRADHVLGKIRSGKVKGLVARKLIAKLICDIPLEVKNQFVQDADILQKLLSPQEIVGEIIETSRTEVVAGDGTDAT